MPKYRKRPVIVEAIQWNGDNYHEIREFCGTHPQGHGSCWYSVDNRNYVGTLEGEMLAQIGDYIIKGVNGEIYPIKEDIFLKTYEAADSNDVALLDKLDT
ncbi:hypothetical protein NLU03_10755 [Bacillus toyonensis]|nr:hypothetical protein [Bacillus toyonensis]